MATISLTIPDAAVPRVLAAFGARFPYLDGQSPRSATPAEVKEAIRKYVIETVRVHEALVAEQTARDSIQPVEVS